ncbi:MAG: histidine kinase [Bacteroidales bacterium]|mgnify:FL=1|nr:histidine kinase [Bacteroidales bacterium]
MKRHTSEANLDLIERIHKIGGTWLILFMVFFAANPNSGFVYRLLDSLTLIVEIMLYVWFINKVLLNKLLSRQKLVGFISLSFVSIVFWAYCSSVVVALLQHYFSLKPIEEAMTLSFVSFLAVFRSLCFISVFVVILVFYYQKKENKERAEAEMLNNEKLDMELRYLKSQINPHFLFNALNNIYTMVYMQDENAPNGVLKLSEMLRYVLVDCQADVIPLSKEMNYLDNFIDFQMMRMEGERDVRFDKAVDNDAYMIAPMLLQPIVENSFKYSRLEAHPEGFVHIAVAQNDGGFRFVAENSVARQTAATSSMENSSGIGLQNIQQRLKLHYGEQCRFEIQQDENIYRVIIEI